MGEAVGDRWSEANLHFSAQGLVFRNTKVTGRDNWFQRGKWTAAFDAARPWLHKWTDEKLVFKPPRRFFQTKSKEGVTTRGMTPRSVHKCTLVPVSPTNVLWYQSHREYRHPEYICGPVTGPIRA